MEETTNSATSDSSNKSKWLKRLGIGFLIFIALLYLGYRGYRYIVEGQLEIIFKETNQMLTGDKVIVDDVDIRPYDNGYDIFRFTVYNPSNYTASPYAFSTGQVKINTSIDIKNKDLFLTITTMNIKDVTINYDINAQDIPNLYQIIYNINKNFNKKYKWSTFILNKVTIEKPKIIIYKNGALITTMTLDNIVLKFDHIPQPINYATALLSGSVQLVNKIDRALGRKNNIN